MGALIFLLSAYGLCFGLMNKAVFLRKVDFLNRMLDCSYCTGFHAGWLTYLMQSWCDFTLSGLVMGAFSGSAFCYIADVTIVYIEERTAQASSAPKRNLFG